MPGMTELPVILHVEDVARLLRKSLRTAYRHVRAGKCGTYTEIGGVIRIRADVFLAAMKGETPKRARR